MRILYSIGFRIFTLILPIWAAFNPKIKKLWKGHRGLMKLIREDMQNDSSRKVWFHAASLGEFEQGRPVMEEYKKTNPDIKIVLTFFSPSGYEIRKNYEGADYIYYLPFDIAANAKKFVQVVNPLFAVFIKYEFWPNYLYYLNKRQCAVYCVSGIFRPTQLFFKKYGSFFRGMLKKLTHFFVQNEESKKLLESIGLANSTISGDTRFDRVIQIVNQARNIEVAERFSKGQQCIVAGSTWPPDEEILAKYINQNDGIQLILAPHEIKPDNITRIKKLFKKACIAFSEATRDTDLGKYSVLLIDNIGMLSSLYQYGQIAYIGGGFGVGIHNTLEAATYGIPVIFGPNYQKFAEAIDLLHTGAAFSIDSFESFSDTLNSLRENPGKIKTSGAAAKEYVLNKAGATKIILKKLNS